MKKIWIALMAAMLCCAMFAVGANAAVWDGTVASGFAGGTGTETDPYTIATAEQLAFFAQSVNGGETYAGKFVKLTADIVMNDTASANWTTAARKWTPIGSYTDSTVNAPFSGTFDGDGHTVSGLYVQDRVSYVGLFAYVKNACVKNVHITNSTLIGEDYIGGVAGIADQSTFYNCENSADIAGESSYKAGIVGFLDSGCAFEKCVNHADIEDGCGIASTRQNDPIRPAVYGTFIECVNKGTISNGYGIALFGDFTDCVNEGDIHGGNGIAKYGTTVLRCVNKGNITPYNVNSFMETYYGFGIVGIANLLDGCINTGKVAGNGIAYYASKVTGCMNSGEVGISGIVCTIPDEGIVEYCYNLGNVTGDTAGGIAGSNAGIIRYCYNTGTVNGGNDAGGIVGVASYSSVENCYNTGSVSGVQNVGGIVGRSTCGEYFKEAFVTNCYNLGQVTGESQYVGGVVGNNHVNSVVTNCYYLENSAIDNFGRVQNGLGAADTSAPVTDIAGQTAVLTNAQMQTQASFAGFDFTDVWTMAGRTDYPYPELVKTALTAAPTVTLPRVLEEIVAPAAVTGIPARTSWAVITGTYLPQNVTLKMTDTSTVEAGVVWTQPPEFDSYAVSEQNLTVNGTVTLPAGVANPDGLPMTVSVNVTIDAKLAELESITQPSTITNIPNGSSIADFGLPTTVQIRVYVASYETRTASVTWDTANCGYDPANTTVQTVVIPGTVTLPDGVTNPNNVSTTTTITVQVNAKAGVTEYHYTGASNIPTVTIDNGTPLAEFDLPTTLTINVNAYTSDTQGNMNYVGPSAMSATVTWNTANCNYDPANTGMQLLSIPGTITLPAGVTNPYNNSTAVTITVQVNAKAGVTEYHYTGVSNIPGVSVPNGTPLAEFDLPETVTINVNGYTSDTQGNMLPTGPSTMSAAVTWDTSNCTYDPDNTGIQLFNIPGTITLPDGVTNPYNNILDIMATVHVMAAGTIQPSDGRQLMSLGAPSPIYDIPSGTELSAVPLPQTVSCMIQEIQNSGLPLVSTVDLPIIWDLAAAQLKYDKTNPHMQHVAVTGTVALPTDVANPSSFSSTVVIHLWFSANPLAHSGESVPSSGAVDAALLAMMLASMQNDKTVQYVTASAGVGGTISPAGATALTNGQELIYTVQPKAGYEVASVLLNGVEQGAVSSLKISGGKSAQSLVVTFRRTPAANPFTDVSAQDAHFEAVLYMLENGIMKGVTKTKFAPEKTMNRAMFIETLGRMEEVDTAYYTDNAFSDLEDDSSFAAYAQWAAENGIVTGYEDGSFGSSAVITVEQAAVILYRYAQYAGVSVKAPAITAPEGVSDWAADAVAWAVESGICTGEDPQAPVTRAAVAEMLYSFCRAFASAK